MNFLLRANAIIFLSINITLCFSQGNSSTKANSKVKLSLDAFNEIPKEMNGCGCELHLNEKDRLAGRFIFLSDYGNFGFANVYGKAERFKLLDHQDDKMPFLNKKGRLK